MIKSFSNLSAIEFYNELVGELPKMEEHTKLTVVYNESDNSSENVLMVFRSDAMNNKKLINTFEGDAADKIYNMLSTFIPRKRSYD